MDDIYAVAGAEPKYYFAPERTVWQLRTARGRASKIPDSCEG